MLSRTSPSQRKRPTGRRRRATAAASLIAATALGLTLVLSGCGALGGGTIDTVGTVDFDTALPIPPLARSHTDAAGEKVFDLTAKAGSTDFLPGKDTSTWGFNGSYLGPTIVADRGDHVRVNVTNALDTTTTVHWHGMYLPAVMDGGPHQMIPAGETWSPHWTIDQPAATLWYHPHLHGKTTKHVLMGLAGMMILKDKTEQALGLPDDYGVDDIPVIVQDRRFDGDGQFTQSTQGFIGPIGNTVLVNGQIGPYLDVTTDVVRLRLLNASAARVYDFAFSDNRSFDLIATDGGLLPVPATLSDIRLAPGERAEILVSMSPGETVTLRSNPPDLGMDRVSAGMNAGNDTLDVMQLRAADDLKPLGQMPTTLVPMVRWKPGEASVTRTFDMHGYRIDDKKMDMSRIDETVVVDRLEQWIVTNSQEEPHSFHVHDMQFQIASVGGKAPSPELAGWKDTIYLEPKTEYRLLMRFADYTDPNVPYMFHCHMLLHEDHGMMGQFVVVGPGQKAGTPPRDTTDMTGGHGSQDMGMNHEH